MPTRTAVAINALTGLRARTLEDAESAQLTARVAPDLYERWGGRSRGSWLGIAGLEVTKLAHSKRETA